MKENVSSEFNPLSLDNQLCFALYVCSKEIVRKYAPLLEPLQLTYTSYITLVALWEEDSISVKKLGERLFLDSGTLTPLLKKMETRGLITRTKGKEDERVIFITLTEQGKKMKDKCKDIPSKIFCSSHLSPDSAFNLLNELHTIMTNFALSKED